MTEQVQLDNFQWGSQNGADLFSTVFQQMEQFRVKFARIVSPVGYEPREVMIVWETLSNIQSRRNITSRGLLSQKLEFMEMKTEMTKDWKYLTYKMSDDSQLYSFITESRAFGHERDVIQFGSVKFNQVLYNLMMENDEFHGPIFVTGPNCHFKFSGESSRKFLYFAQPTPSQLRTKSEKERIFVICVYDFSTRRTSVITDESICTQTITAVEWTPDSRGIVFHRATELIWHRFGEQYLNIIYPNAPIPLKISFSPFNNRLAVFFPANNLTEDSIVLFHWPFVKAAVEMQHSVVSLGNHNVWKVPDRPWAFNGRVLMFNANWQSSVITFSLLVETLQLDKFTFPRPGSIVDVQNGDILFETIAANSPSRVWMTSLSSEIKNIQFTAALLGAQRPIFDNNQNFEMRCVHFDDNSYTGILYMPQDTVKPGEKLPLVVASHAGCEPNYTQSSVDPLYSTLVNSGYCVLVVNSRTQFAPVMLTGFPVDFNTEIVDDVHNAVLQTLDENKNRIDRDNVCLYGLEYGSFVASNLIVKFPFFYKCAALYRPRLDLPGETPMTPEKIDFLTDFQAITNPDKVKTPLLFVMGMDEDMLYSDFKEKLLANNISCWEEFEEDDQEYNDFIVKIVHFFEDPTREKDRKLIEAIENLKARSQ